MPTTKPQQLIACATEKLKSGWTQGVSEEIINGQRCFCALGALSTCVTGDSPYMHHRIPEPVVSALYAVLPDDYKTAASSSERDCIVDYNDKAGRTQAEVVALFEQAQP